MAESCDRHMHSIFRPCVNGAMTIDYLLAEQHTTALAEQSKRYTETPMNSDAGEADE